MALRMQGCRLDAHGPWRASSVPLQSALLPPDSKNIGPRGGGKFPDISRLTEEP